MVATLPPWPLRKNSRVKPWWARDLDQPPIDVGAVQHLRPDPFDALGVAYRLAVGCAVAGLVVITPASGFVKPMPAILMGLVGGVVCFLMVSKVKAMFGYDDSLDAFGIHGIGGGHCLNKNRMTISNF